jgi:hypothetical protein
MTSRKRGTPAGFPEIPNESCMDRRVRLIVWKQKNGIKSGDLKNRKRQTLASLGKEVVRLRKELEDLRAKLLGEGGGQCRS